MKKTTRLFLLGIISFFFSTFSWSQEKDNQIVNHKKNNSLEKQNRPYVIFISADGFRYDYAKKFNAQNLIQLANQGVEAKSMFPAFPSITFPNHYTLATGLYPAHHGLVGNNIYDSKFKERYSLRNNKAVRDAKWYGGIPIWTLAEQQQLLTACYYWPGSEAPIGGVFPTYYYPYSEKTQIASRIKTVVDWLKLPEHKRPHLITFYLPETDHAGHRFGPDAQETAQAVAFIDKVVKDLNEAVATTGLNVNFIFVSDHGMIEINTEELMALPIEIDPEKVQVASNGTMVSLHVNDPTDIASIYSEIKSKKGNFQVYLKGDIPSKWHMNKKDDVFNRVGDIVLFANAPYYFGNKKTYIGAHGYDPHTTKEMQATFYAWGPAFKKGLKIKSFDNVQIYPLIAKILGLQINHPIDGNFKLADQILIKK